VPSISGGGRRSRYAVTDEIRLPFLAAVTMTASGRYDAYRISGQTVQKATYDVGLEWKPVESLLFRSRYGTAFKAPTLADEFQGRSSITDFETDYYQCAQLGFTGLNIGNCPYVGTALSASTSGDLKLKPITADVWDIGLVWSPLREGSISADFLHWSIANEVAIQSGDELLRREAQCRLGQLDINSPTCAAALSQVTRDATGLVTAIFTPRLNISREIASAFTLQVNQGIALGGYGRVEFQLSWSDLLKHTFQQFPGDSFVNELQDPTFSTDFKSKVNASINWTRAQWSSTLYVNRVGGSPNFLAVDSGYATSGAGKLPPWTLCNFNLRYSWELGLSAGVTVDNLFDRMPPVDHSYPGTGSEPFNDANYSVYGRSFYLQLTYRGVR